MKERPSIGLKIEIELRFGFFQRVYECRVNILKVKSEAFLCSTILQHGLYMLCWLVDTYSCSLWCSKMHRVVQYDRKEDRMMLHKYLFFAQKKPINNQ